MSLMGADVSDDAIEMLRDAVEHLERSPAHLDLARTLVSLGVVLRRGGRAPKAARRSARATSR